MHERQDFDFRLQCVCSPATIPPGNLTCRASVPGTLTVEWIDPFPEDCQAAFEVSWEGHALWDEGLSESNNATASESLYTLTDVIPNADYTLDVAVWFQGEYPGATASIQCTTLAESGLMGIRFAGGSDAVIRFVFHEFAFVKNTGS